LISLFRIHICYLHPKDQEYALRFQRLLGSDCLRCTGSSEMADGLTESEIKDNHIRNAVATVVLIGPQTAASERVDEEICASLLSTDRYLHTGLFGVLLPSCSAGSSSLVKQDLVPSRLGDNLRSGFADLYLWREDSSLIRAWFQRAVRKRDTLLPDNRRPLLNKKTRHSLSYTRT